MNLANTSKTSYVLVNKKASNKISFEPSEVCVISSVGHCIQWNSNTDTPGPLKCVLIREVSSFQGVNNTYLYDVGTWSSVLNREVSIIQGCLLKGVPLYTKSKPRGGDTQESVL